MFCTWEIGLSDMFTNTITLVNHKWDDFALLCQNDFVKAVRGAYRTHHFSNVTKHTLRSTFGHHLGHGNWARWGACTHVPLVQTNNTGACIVWWRHLLNNTAECCTLMVVEMNAQNQAHSKLVHCFTCEPATQNNIPSPPFHVRTYC